MNDTAVRAIPRRVHLVGVGGIHMSAIARILRARGHTVSGSDLHLSPLTAKLTDIGVTVHEGHDATNVDDARLVVYTSAAHDDNPELAEARRRGIATIKRAEMVARLAEGKQLIAVAGTHGKTTTSSLIAYMLWRAGLSPTFMVGGEMLDLDTNAMPGEGPHFVVEADEYDRAFLQYHPYIALVTNVEPDHLDIYGSFENLTDAFRRFLSQVENSGYIVACTDSPALQAILPQTVGDDVTFPVHVVSYGLHADADWTAKEISPAINKVEERKGIDASTFVVEFRKQRWGVVQTRLPGVHNISNVLGAVAVGHILGLPADGIRTAIAEFRGARRRFQLVGEAGGVRVMDSYAHHPTEIRADLAAARERFPGRRLVCLFQPHTYTRTRYLLDGFRTCFRDSDVLLIARTYAAREEPSAGLSGEDLAREIGQPPTRYTGDLEESSRAVAALLRPGDVFFTIGAGDIEHAGPMVLDLLRATESPGRGGGARA
ncbi:MAG: UDP-N-acetylmuramate--L-alanine ligase [Dehalococcoidia bacterium]|nr:UDP-N-acetylmuramate--L-alanine ligase [Dehalococcoidia bacterium]